MVRTDHAVFLFGRAWHPSIYLLGGHKGALWLLAAADKRHRINGSLVSGSWIHKYIWHVRESNSRFNTWRLIFIDETSVDLRVMYQLMGWVGTSSRATQRSHFVHGTQRVVVFTVIIPQLLIMVLGSHYYLHSHLTDPSMWRSGSGPMMESCSFNILKTFSNTWILIPPHIVCLWWTTVAYTTWRAFLSVVLHSNISFISLLSRQFAEAHRGVKLLYLPAYSPDYNPVEELFSYIKVYIRRHGERFRAATEMDDEAAPFLFLYMAVSTIDASCAQAWFHDCGICKHGHCSYIVCTNTDEAMGKNVCCPGPNRYKKTNSWAEGRNTVRGKIACNNQR